MRTFFLQIPLPLLPHHRLFLRSVSHLPLQPDSDRSSVVVDYTSLRVVRHTYDDCRVVRFILCGFIVALDERDVSVDKRFRQELQEILGGRRRAPLSSVFVGGLYISGVDDVRRLYDRGELHDG
ncbi:hypothetical protein Fmac_020153 [Flemingia macrophylla]|uniref:Glutaredoxin domain-containing protein n=1 Tax=Flemingia macrophylla TaxID=520843 RepID=A0ABD1MA09_9FABA